MKRTQLFPKVKFFFIFFNFLLIYSSCEDNYQPIPSVHVDITKFLHTDLAALQIGNPLAISGGYNGIILCKLSEDEIVAFDRTCTYEPDHTCIVTPDHTGIFAECSCCKSKYELIGGNVNKGPSSQPLMQYRVVINGEIVHITN